MQNWLLEKFTLIYRSTSGYFIFSPKTTQGNLPHQCARNIIATTFVWHGDWQKNLTVCVSDYSLYIAENYIQEILLHANGLFSFSITPLNLTAVLSFEDIPKGVKVLPTTEITALMSNKHCRNMQSGFWQALTFSLKEQPDNTQAKVKHISLASTFQTLSHCKF